MGGEDGRSGSNLSAKPPHPFHFVSGCDGVRAATFYPILHLRKVYVVLRSNKVDNGDGIL